VSFTRNFKCLQPPKTRKDITLKRFPSVEGRGKIFFLAPTKPLVNQQFKSFRNTPGLRNIHVCELTGSISPKERRNLYAKKAIFFMTPETLENDLKKQFFNPHDIVLLIVDEAHRA
jgi:ATP-dependent DNA helicase MPH1